MPLFSSTLTSVIKFIFQLCSLLLISDPFSRQSSRIFDEQAEDLNYEKRKTDGLLQQLLPVDIIAKLKSGEQPSPR